MRHLFIFIFAIVAVVAGRSQAAPQILGLIATNGAATPLHCKGEVCEAQFSTFCLQKARATPTAYTPYELVEGSPVAFVVTQPNGAQTTIPAKDLTIRTFDTYASVVISVPAARVRALGGSVAVQVGKNATLAPEPQPNDPNPITQLELDMAAGKLRPVGSTFVDQAGMIADAVRLSMRLINEVAPARTQSALQQVRGRAERVLRSGDIDPGARDLLYQRLAYCNNIIEDRWTAASLRVCMRGHHAKLIDSLNWPYWDATGAGM